jgi:hypothetical protein
MAKDRTGLIDGAVYHCEEPLRLLEVIVKGVAGLNYST